jgi:hypothetical protein
VSAGAAAALQLVPAKSRKERTRRRCECALRQTNTGAWFSITIRSATGDDFGF